jgi:hypothetical protein
VIPERAPRRRRRRLLTVLAAVALALLAFALGVAVGQALEDSPQSGDSVTRVRTLKPVPLPPARVTVTVTAP